MQPPKSQSVVSVPVPVQELNTAAAANVHNGTSTNHNGNNMVSLQNLLQSGMAVQVSQHQTQTSNSIPVHLNIAGLQSPVTLSLNLQDQQQQKMVPTSSMVTVASAASTGGTGKVFSRKKYLYKKKTHVMFFSFIISENFEFYFMNALVYVDIDRGTIHMIRIKVA